MCRDTFLYTKMLSLLMMPLFRRDHNLNTMAQEGYMGTIINFIGLPTAAHTLMARVSPFCERLLACDFCSSSVNLGTS